MADVERTGNNGDNAGGSSEIEYGQRNTTTADIGTNSRNTVVGSDIRQTVTEYPFSININSSTDEWRATIASQLMELSQRIRYIEEDIEERNFKAAHRMTLYQKLVLGALVVVAIAIFYFAYSLNAFQTQLSLNNRLEQQQYQR